MAAMDNTPSNGSHSTTSPSGHGWLSTVKPFISIFFVTLIITIVYGFAVNGWYRWQGGDLNAGRGTFGDMFGALTSFTTTLAFAAIVIQIRQASKDAEDQRKDTAEQLAAITKQHQLAENTSREQKSNLKHNLPR